MKTSEGMSKVELALANADISLFSVNHCNATKIGAGDSWAIDSNGGSIPPGQYLRMDVSLLVPYETEPSVAEKGHVDAERLKAAELNAANFKLL